MSRGAKEPWGRQGGNILIAEQRSKGKSSEISETTWPGKSLSEPQVKAVRRVIFYWVLEAGLSKDSSQAFTVYCTGANMISISLSLSLPLRLYLHLSLYMSLHIYIIFQTVTRGEHWDSSQSSHTLKGLMPKTNGVWWRVVACAEGWAVGLGLMVLSCLLSSWWVTLSSRAQAVQRDGYSKD